MGAKNRSIPRPTRQGLILDGPAFAGIVYGLPGYGREAAAGVMRIGELSV
jgi:hypothetical protein